MVSAENNDLSVGVLYVIILSLYLIVSSLRRSGQTNEHRCNMTCVAGGQAWAPFCKDLFQVCYTPCTPMNGTIGHLNNKQHILLEFSNSEQRYQRATPNKALCFAMVVLPLYYYVGADVALRLVAQCASPTLLGFSLSPQPGEVSRSRSHSVSRTGP